MTQAALVHHPGVILKREIEARGWTPEVLAIRLGVPKTYVYALLIGGLNIDVRLALDLERIVGPSAEMWLSMQMNYDLFMARKELE